jgi:2-dehydro-3-deoxygluconokinase
VSTDKDVVTVGETMAMFRAMSEGPISSTTLFEFGWGGAETNVAIGLKRLGIQTTWVSALGDDIFGDTILRALETEGVRVEATTDSENPTGLMVKIPIRGEDPVVRYFRSGSAASALDFTAQVEDALSQARWIHLTGIFPALSETTRNTAHEIVDYAVMHSIPYSFDINYRPQLWSRQDARSTLLALASDAAIVFGGLSELEILVGAHSSIEDSLTAVSDLGPGEVVAKLGSDGALALVGDRFLSAPAHPVDVVDTVGAGDAFVAGYLSQRLRHENPERALLRGTLCGAAACSKPGDWEGAPLLSDIVRLETAVLV